MFRRYASRFGLFTVLVLGIMASGSASLRLV